MSLWIEKQWINQIAIHLPRFKWKRNNVAEFRCIVCKDSEKSARKTRGYAYEWKGRYIIKCHNCGYCLPFALFLQDFFPESYKEFKVERFREQMSFSSATKTIDENKLIPEQPALGTAQYNNNSLKQCFPANRVEIALSTCHARQIPDRSINRIYYTDNFDSFVQSNWPDIHKQYDHLPNDERLLLFLYHTDGTLFGFQGRAIQKSAGIRYITIKLDNHVDHKIFGLDQLDTTRPHIILEGPIDSLLLPNAIALCGADIGRSLDYIDTKNAIFAFDNEPRSIDTVNRMKTAIDRGCRIVFWSHNIQGKDPNEMILNGHDRKDILNELKYNSFFGARAKLELSRWRRI